MKILCLVRHAKSSWAMDSQPDIDRPLNERGYTDAPAMSRRLHKEKCNPDVIISSPAIRAISTALIFAEGLGYSKEKIMIRENLFVQDRSMYLECIHSLADSFSSAMLFGHNPVISEFAQYLLAKEKNDLMAESPDMPTCSVVSIKFEVDTWHKVLKNAGRMDFFITPGMLKTQ